MIHEAIEKIESLVQESIVPEYIRRPGDPPHIITLINSDGGTMQQTVEPGLRKIELSSLGDLIDLGKTHFDDVIQTNKRMVCFYNREQVELVFDHENGRERARVALLPTSEFAFFKARLTNPQIEAKDLRQALIATLRKTFTDARIVAQVSKLGTTNTANAGIEINRGKESIRQDVLSVVAEPENLPDPFQTFNIRTYANPDLDVRYPLQCMLDPDTQNRRWSLLPLEDSWIDFQQAMALHIGHMLRKAFAETPVRVFEGTFNQDAIAKS